MTILKSLIPHIIAIIVFIAITLTYFYPVLEGKVIRQDDIIRFRGMSKEIVDYRAKTGKEPLWTNSMFGGMPAYQISLIFHGNLIRKIEKILWLGIPYPICLIFLTLLGFYFLCVTLRINSYLSILGAIAFTFSSYFFIILQSGHNSKLYAIAYIAPVIAGVLLTYRGRWLLGGIITSFALALQINANHLQITYYLLLTILILIIVKFIYSIKEKHPPMADFIKASVILAIAGILAVAPNIGNLWTTYEYSKVTTRGKSDLTFNKEQQTTGLDRDYITAWSYGVSETMTLLIPNFKGGASYGELKENSETYKILNEKGVENVEDLTKQMPLYWGPQPFTSGPVYVGAIVVFLFIFGLFVVKGEFKWWLLFATILSILLSWGRNFPAFTNLFLDYFPAYNKFRAVAMILVIAEFTMPLLAVLALQKIFENSTDEGQKEQLFKSLKLSFYIVGGITLFFALFGGAFFDFSSPEDKQYIANGWPNWLINAIQKDRENLLKMDALRSFVFVLLSAIILWTIIRKKWLEKNYAIIGLTFLILIDMWAINKRYMNNEKERGKYLYWVSKKEYEKPYQPTKIDIQILQDKDPNFRVLNLTARFDQDARTSYFHKNIGGYHGAKLKRFQELIDYQLSKRNRSVINMLNVKYIIQRDERGETVLSSNPDVLGDAWFVEGYKLVENADSEITALTNFDPAKTLIVDKRYKPYLENFIPKPDTTASIKLTEYQPNYLVYASKANSEQLAVFSEIYYKDGWNAYVDGKLTPHFRANYVLRAMRIPAGEHKIEFKFEPRAYYAGEKISLAGSIILIVLFIGIIAREIRKQLAVSSRQ